MNKGKLICSERTLFKTALHIVTFLLLFFFFLCLEAA